MDLLDVLCKKHCDLIYINTYRLNTFEMWWMVSRSSSDSSVSEHLTKKKWKKPPPWIISPFRTEASNFKSVGVFVINSWQRVDLFPSCYHSYAVNSNQLNTSSLVNWWPHNNSTQFLLPKAFNFLDRLKALTMFGAKKRRRKWKKGYFAQ